MVDVVFHYTINLINMVSKAYWNSVITGMESSMYGAKRRIKMIAAFKKNPWKWSVLVAVLIVGISFVVMKNGYSKSLWAEKFPSTKIIANIESLTEEEYSEVGMRGIGKPIINDFMKFTLDVSIIDADDVISKEFIVPDLGKFKEYINKNEDRFWFADGSDQNNKDEDFSRATRDIMIYFRGLDENEIRKRLKSAKIMLGWATKDGEKVKKEYSIGEVLTFDGRAK